MKRILITGPESTGKSTLCKELAAHYDTVWCPEFAREYLLKKGTNYRYQDLANIAHGQIELEEKMQAEAKNGFYFIDTDMYVMKVWHEVAFHNCPTWILKKIAQTHYDLYLLCNTDLPWIKDELREYPDLAARQKLFKMYKDIMINSGTPWVEIRGTDAQRLQIAISTIDSIYKSKSSFS
jgi:NadR type nicotinamide-nucleotide adenylyltransferase